MEPIESSETLAYINTLTPGTYPKEKKLQHCSFESIYSVRVNGRQYFVAYHLPSFLGLCISLFSKLCTSGVATPSLAVLGTFISFNSKEPHSLYKLFSLLTHCAPMSIKKTRICKEKFLVFKDLQVYKLLYRVSQNYVNTNGLF